MLETLSDASEGIAAPLSPNLEQRYGGPLRLPTGRPFVYANFVSTLDGVVSFGSPTAEAKHISRGFASDRFVMALLRAVADVVVIGAGTLRAERGAVLTPEQAFPAARDDFARLRTALGKPAQPTAVVVSATGRIDGAARLFQSGQRVVVVTSEAADPGARAALPDVEWRIAAGAPPSGRQLLDAIADLGPAVLCEGGPALLGTMLAAGVVHELFLTIAPQLAGRSPTERRLGLVEGVAFTPAQAPWGRLRGIKRDGDYLFLRLAL